LHSLLHAGLSRRTEMPVFRTSPIKGNVKRKISPIGSMASHCCQGIQPHCLSGHSYSESDFPQAVRSVWSPRAQRRFFLSPVVPFRCVTAPIIF
jgi:hypothetical protein